MAYRSAIVLGLTDAEAPLFEALYRNLCEQQPSATRGHLCSALISLCLHGRGAEVGEFISAVQANTRPSKPLPVLIPGPTDYETWVDQVRKAAVRGGWLFNADLPDWQDWFRQGFSPETAIKALWDKVG